MKRVNLILSLVLSFVILFGFSKPLYAGTPLSGAIKVLETYSNGIEFFSSLSGFDGESITQLFNKFGTAAADVSLSYICPQCTEEYVNVLNSDLPDIYKYGLTGIVENNVVAMFESQPQVDVIAHLSEEWVPGYESSKSVYASGYDDLMRNGISDLWSFTRNLAYLGFVVVMIVIGFMIMFRSKIGGQMLVTVGNSLPRVVIALVLVTFSFAIAGIILDVTGVIMRLISATLDSGINVHNIFSLLSGVFGLDTLEGAKDLGIAVTVLAVVGALTGGVGTVIVLLLALVVLGIALFGAIKLWFTLVKSYLSILLNVIISPLAIMIGAIPGNDASTLNIFKSILRNALVFPMAYAIVNLPHFLELKGVSLAFPESVVGVETGGGESALSGLILAVAKIIAIYVAAQSPIFLQAIIPATAPKSGADVAGAVKAGLSKVPLIGGMFAAK